MFTNTISVHTTIGYENKDKSMATHIRLDSIKIKRAQRALRADTETETIDRALDFVISELERNRFAAAAHNRFLRSRMKILRAIL